MAIKSNMEELNKKTFAKNLKKGKIFAIHNVTRRIQLLRNKTGTKQQVEKNTRKADRLKEEIDFIKDFDVEVVLKKIQDKPELLENSINMNDIVDIEDRALARLILSKPIQSGLKNKKSATKPGRKMAQKMKKKASAFPTQTRLEERITSSQSSDEEDVLLERTHQSLFVGSMAALSKDATKNTSKKTKDSKKKVPKKPSNRLGQRARQRLWEEKYGKNACHIKTNIKGTGKDPNKSKQDRQKPRPIKKELNPNTRRQEVSHPSWEASKKRKLEHNISQTQFQGKKIVFDD